MLKEFKGEIPINLEMEEESKKDIAALFDCVLQELEKDNEDIANLEGLVQIIIRKKNA